MNKFFCVVQSYYAGIPRSIALKQEKALIIINENRWRNVILFAFGNLLSNPA